MTVSEWIDHVDRLRETDHLLARGYWHGYLEGEASATAAPMRGRYYLVRWEQPTVAVSHNDRGQLVKLAHAIEEAVG